jgi:hypothetical protein
MTQRLLGKMTADGGLLVRFAGDDRKLGRPRKPPRQDDFDQLLLTSLGPRMCHWPVEERPDLPGHFLFCGRPASGGRYCAAHTALASRGKPEWTL